uniref:Conserved oligomeric Golgi complex subunit 3 n=1 Tax=Heterorhabditis bacteriophora TaxID=37862 RepID=A0A1I7WVF0_HETBA
MDSIFPAYGQRPIIEFEYGTPKPGTLTEKRAKTASMHIGNEMLYLCEIINNYGYESSDGKIRIKFGKLFSVYQFISDKSYLDLSSVSRFVVLFYLVLGHAVSCSCVFIYEFYVGMLSQKAVFAILGCLLISTGSINIYFFSSIMHFVYMLFRHNINCSPLFITKVLEMPYCLFYKRDGSMGPCIPPLFCTVSDSCDSTCSNQHALLDAQRLPDSLSDLPGCMTVATAGNVTLGGTIHSFTQAFTLIVEDGKYKVAFAYSIHMEISLKSKFFRQLYIRKMPPVVLSGGSVLADALATVVREARDQELPLVERQEAPEVVALRANMKRLRILKERIGMCQKVLNRFAQADIIMKKLNNTSKLSVTGQTFTSILASIDECLSFLRQHPEYKESAVYIAKYEQCLSRFVLEYQKKSPLRNMLCFSCATKTTHFLITL